MADATLGSVEPEDKAGARFDGAGLFKIAVVSALLSIYALIEFSMYEAHVPWRDEGQAWFWAKTLSQPLDFLIVPGEGHPPLWYWLLRLLSLGLDFTQARLFTVGAAVFNAGLIFWLFRRHLLIAALIVFSAASLHFWGYNFRPYTLVFTLTLLALVAHQNGRPGTGSWLMAIACGFHFFAGILFAFWLTIAWRDGQRIRDLIAPCILALAFAATVLLSGVSNASIEYYHSKLAQDILSAFGAVYSGRFYPPAVAGALALVLVTIIFWRDRLTLAVYLCLAGGFAVFAAAIYGRYDWHLAFVLALLVMALASVRAKLIRWPLLLLLAPGAVFGVLGAAYETTVNPRYDEIAFEAIKADAGDRLDTQTNLVSWPDFPLLGIAARDDFKFLSGNDGALVGPVNLAKRRDWQVAFSTLADMPRPYWVYCISCSGILFAITETGRPFTLLYNSGPQSPEPVAAFRVD